MRNLPPRSGYQWVGATLRSKLDSFGYQTVKTIHLPSMGIWNLSPKSKHVVLNSDLTSRDIANATNPIGISNIHTVLFSLFRSGAASCAPCRAVIAMTSPGVDQPSTGKNWPVVWNPFWKNKPRCLGFQMQLFPTKGCGHTERTLTKLAPHGKSM